MPRRTASSSSAALRAGRALRRTLRRGGIP